MNIRLFRFVDGGKVVSGEAGNCERSSLHSVISFLATMEHAVVAGGWILFGNRLLVS